MKVELDSDQQDQLKGALDSNQVRRWLIQKENMKFEVGDVLLRYSLQTRGHNDPKWIVENINSDNKMAQRYVYIYEDEFGIGFVKQLRVSDGSLGKDIWCMTEFDFGYTKFEVDPEYAEKVFLDGEFDIREIHKASLANRKIITKMNRKIGTKPRSLKEYNDIFDNLKVGDTFWTTSDYTGRYMQEFTLTNIKQVSVQTLNRENDWDWRRWKEKNTGHVDAPHSYKISYTGTYPRQDCLITSMRGDVFFMTQKPAQEEKK